MKIFSKYFLKYAICFSCILTVAMQENQLQLYQLVERAAPELQTAISNKFSHFYNYDTTLNTLFVTAHILQKLIYTVEKSENGQDVIVFKTTDNAGNHLIRKYPSPFYYEGNNIIIGPNKNNHMVINNIFFDITNDTMKILSPLCIEKPVALHPTRPLVCVKQKDNNRNNDYPYNLCLYDLSTKSILKYRFRYSLERHIYPCKSTSYQRVFFGPDIKNIPTLWINTEPQKIRLFYLKENKKTSAISYFNFGKAIYVLSHYDNLENNDIEKLSDFFCNNQNPAQLLYITLSEHTSEAGLHFQSDQKDGCNNFIKKNLNTEFLTLPCCMGSPSMLPQVIVKNKTQLTEAYNYNPSSVLHIIQEDEWDTKEWFLRQMKALVLFNALKQFSEQHHSDEDEKELVKLMRTNPDKYKIILHAQQLETVKNYMKILQQKYTRRKL